jgi:hypothetical protein
MAVFAGIREDADKRVQAALAGSDLAKLDAALKTALEAKQAQVAQIGSQIQALETSLQEQAKVLGAISEPFKFLAADVRYLVTRFPALLGVLWGVSAWLRGSSLARLAAIGSGGDPVNARETIRFLVGSPINPLTDLAGRVGLGCAWVTIAAWQFRAMPASGTSALSLGAVGSGCVILGAILRAAALRSVTRQHGDAPKPS